MMLLKSRETLLLLVAVTGCHVLAGCNAAAEQAAYRKVREAGGRLSFGGGGLDVEFSNRKVTDEQLATLLVLPSIHNLRIENVPLSDSAVDVLLSVRQIGRLTIVNTKISVEGLSRLKARYPNLRQK